MESLSNRSSLDLVLSIHYRHIVLNSQVQTGAWDDGQHIGGMQRKNDLDLHYESHMSIYYYLRVRAGGDEHLTH